MPALPENPNEFLNQWEEEEKKIPVIAESEPKLDKEVEPYIEKLEKEIYLTKPITDDGGQPLISPPAPQHPIITLPISKLVYGLGLKKKVTESLRWLSEWCFRLVKIFGNRVVFREEKQG